jgi:hypothetical protein
MSTAIHSRQNRPDWRGFARRVESFAAPFVHNREPKEDFADDDWLKSAVGAPSAHLTPANEVLTLK